MSERLHRNGQTSHDEVCQSGYDMSEHESDAPVHEERECSHCGKTFAVDTGSEATDFLGYEGQNHHYCSPECQQTAHHVHAVKENWERWDAHREAQQ